jgi:hypothetical protein
MGPILPYGDYGSAAAMPSTREKCALRGRGARILRAVVEATRPDEHVGRGDRMNSPATRTRLSGGAATK